MQAHVISYLAIIFVSTQAGMGTGEHVVSLCVEESRVPLHTRFSRCMYSEVEHQGKCASPQIMLYSVSHINVMYNIVEDILLIERNNIC